MFILIAINCLSTSLILSNDYRDDNSLSKYDAIFPLILQFTFELIKTFFLNSLIHADKSYFKILHRLALFANFIMEFF